MGKTQFGAYSDDVSQDSGTYAFNRGLTADSFSVSATETAPTAASDGTAGQIVIADGGFYLCTATGSPGTWVTAAFSAVV